jgi:fermentation-respiration switch protein FrsA (DUF1100 family)
MKRLSAFLLIALFSMNIVQAQCKQFAGQWNGALKVQGIQLRLVFNISCKGDTASASFDSPDQGAKGIAFEKVTIEGTQLTIEAPALRANYKATLIGDTLLDGTWSQGGMSLPLVLLRSEKPITINRPQEPQKPYPYHTEEVQFESKSLGITLSGTLSLPKGNGPFKAVVLVSGSGPQNRDEELLSHKPFLVLADYLTRQGIAVLRYDDRGIGLSGGDFSTATSLDFADDAEGALEYLLKRPEIDKNKIGIAGHSEGGMIAPVVAARNTKVAFIVMLAGPGQKSIDLMADQARLVSVAEGETEAAIAESLQLNAQLFDILLKQPNDSIALHEMKSLALETIESSKALSAEEKKLQIDQLPITLKRVLNPWFRMFIAWDPAVWLEKVKCPVLAINGSNDLQVPANKNLPLVEAALKKGGNKQATTVELKGLNHLFQHCETGSPSKYGTIEETFAPEALEAIAMWMKKM